MLHSPTMHHPSARRAVSAILASDGFDRRACALVHAARLDEITGADDALRDEAIARCEAMEPDKGLGYSGPLHDEPLPDDANQVCAQLAPLIMAHSAQTGRQLACLEGLVALWPHVGANERNGMRARWLASACTRTAPAGSAVSLAELETWQRDLPTSGAIDETPQIAALKALLRESEARRAYLVIADHLGCTFKPGQLASVLGALAIQLQVQFRDNNQGWLVQVLHGATAAEALVGRARPEHLATLLSQLAHQLWWCRQKANLQPLRVCLDASVHPLVEAVRSGDISSAQRSARIASVQADRFWKHILILLRDAIRFDDIHWARALIAVRAVAKRSQAGLAPDDAAGLATVLGEIVWQRNRKPVTAG